METMVVIYENPSDYPGQFVARVWLVGAGWFKPTQRCVTATTLPAVREKMRESFGMNLYKMPRDQMDDPCIVEVWV